MKSLDTLTQEALDPCPFCGGAARVSRLPGTQKQRGGHFAYCDNDQCLIGPDSPFFDSPEEAAAAWNTRPVPKGGAR